MDILPAIDLLGAAVVRLAQGDYERRTKYSSDPAGVASSFIAAGAKWIHVVDLDAARTGKPTNYSEIRVIRKVSGDSGVKVQLGGGARDERTIDVMLEELADRVVVGSAALKDWKWFEELIGRRGDIVGRLALGLDARDGHVAAEGWTEQLPDTAVEIAARVAGSGLGAIVYTDIARDGMLTGPNVAATAEVVSATDVPVIASGGVSSLQDVLECKQAGCAGAIIGKAYYEGRIDLKQACILAEKK